MTGPTTRHISITRKRSASGIQPCQPAPVAKVYSAATL